MTIVGELGNLTTNMKKGKETQKEIEGAGLRKFLTETTEDAASFEMTKAANEVTNSKVSELNVNETVKIVVETTEIPRNNQGVKIWANMVAGNKLAERGMNLQFIPPVIHEGLKKVQF